MIPDQIITIGPGRTVSFTVESAAYLTGCEGTLVYEVSGSSWQNRLIYWNNPYCGHNTYSHVLHGKSLPVTTHWDHENDDEARVVYTFSDPTAPFVAAVAPPPQTAEQGGTVGGAEERHVSLPRVECKVMADPPLLPLHDVEADSDGSDKFAAGTCMLKSKVMCYFPSTKPPENRVLIYFAAMELDQFVPMMAARAAAEKAGWILFAIDCYPESDSTYLSAEEIVAELHRHRFKGGIDRLRMAAHSRGILRLMVNTSEGKQLVSKSPTGPVVNIASVERVISFDATHANSPLAAVLARFPGLFGFRADMPEITTLPATQRFCVCDDKLRALAAARVIQALPLWRKKWPKMLQIANPEPSFEYVEAVAAMRLPPVGEITSDKAQDIFRKIRATLKDRNITARQLGDEAIRVGDTKFLMHNWALPDFFHEVLADKAPQAMTDDPETECAGW